MKLISSPVFFCSLLLSSSPTTSAKSNISSPLIAAASAVGGGLRRSSLRKLNTTTTTTRAAPLTEQHEAQQHRGLTHDVPGGIATALFPILRDNVRALELAEFENTFDEFVWFNRACCFDEAKIKYRFMRFRNRRAAFGSAFSELNPDTENLQYYFVDKTSNDIVYFSGFFLFTVYYVRDVKIKIRARLRDAANDCGQSPQNTEGFMNLEGLTETFTIFVEGRYSDFTSELVEIIAGDLISAAITYDAISTNIAFNGPVVFDLEPRFVQIWEDIFPPAPSTADAGAGVLPDASIIIDVPEVYTGNFTF